MNPSIPRCAAKTGVVKVGNSSSSISRCEPRERQGQIAGDPDRLLVEAGRCQAAGEHALAAEHLQGLLRLAPDFAPAWRALVPALLALGRATEALTAARQSVILEPDSAESRHSVALAAEALGSIDEAIGAAEAELALQPTSSSGWALLAHLHARRGDKELAMLAGRRALACDPNNIVARYNLAVCLQALGRLDEAEIEYRTVLSADDRHHGAWVNLGALLRARGQEDRAIATWRSGTERTGGSAELRFNLGCGLLQVGSWAEGWLGYEERWQLHGWTLPAAAKDIPRWTGQPVTDGPLLVCHEQGLGDTLQFVRLLPALRSRVHSVYLACPARLHRLLRSSTFVGQHGGTSDDTFVRLVDDGESPADARAWTPLLSLPMQLGLTQASLAADVPYLSAEPDLVARWKARIEEFCPRRPGDLRIGICWQGNPNAPADQGRSLPLALLLPLGRIPGVRLVSLQKGPGREQLTTADARTAVVDLGAELDTGPDAFVDTAAALASLDLLVTSDTAVAHLAGALGRPVWLLLKFVPDWRWARSTGRTPWYPTMRLFHQPTSGDWVGAVDRVLIALTELVALRRGPVAAASNPLHPQAVLEALRTGRTDEAIAGYHELLRFEPDRADFLQLLAVAVFEHGRRSPASAREALVYAERAADLAPRDPDVHANLGLLLKSAGRLDDAATALRHALALTDSRHEPALNNLVNLLIRKGEGEQAVAVAERALAVGATATRLASLARALQAAGHLEQAASVWRNLISREPDVAAHRVALGAAFSERDPEAAQKCFEEALALDPDQADALTDLGVLERARGHAELATWFHKRALTASPDHVAAWTNLGVNLLERGQVGPAQEAFHEALKRRPDQSDAFMALGMSLLLQGRFEEGLEAYEHRRRCVAAGLISVPSEGREWQGEDPRGLRILIVAEQGFGDAIQFVRYAELLKERGARSVIVGCRAALARLLARARGVDEIVVEGAKLPPFDAWAPLMSLPRLFGTRLETIPCWIPYLSPEPERVASWARILAGRPGLRVGLTWQGNPDRRVDAGRSIALARLEPLTQVPGVRLISLQKGPGSEQLAISKLPIERLQPELDQGPDAFVDTAAVMANLDLVVTTDTAVAHLAGALGRPVWLLLKYPPEWRWLLDREDSPWYPTMRLFRQRPEEVDGDPWGPVVARLCAELCRLASGDRSRLIPSWSGDGRASAGDPTAGHGASRAAPGSEFGAALALHRAGDLTGAARKYARILANWPDHGDALHMMGVLALQQGRHHRALIFLREAARVGLQTPELASNLALALKALGRVEEAERLLREAIERRPGYAEALINLGNLLRERDRPAEAVECFRAASRCGPPRSAALRGLGNALRETGALGEALQALQAAVEADLMDPEAHLDLAQALLSAGELRRGFREYEWRWRSAEMQPRVSRAPRWDGQPFRDRVLLVHGEQGLGDHIMFARFLAPVAKLGGRIVLECRRELHGLFGQLASAIADFSLAVQGEEPPPHDLEVPLASLPHWLDLDLGSVPSDVPYLWSDPSRRESWRRWLGFAREELRVGLVWQGNPRARADRGRSVPLATLAPVLRTEGARFVSLQKEHGLDQLDLLPEGARVARPGPPFDEGPDAFLDTAALLDELDLVITSDTAVAHLAGALGRPVWLLLKFAPDWRWLTGRSDSPWYPTMRLYRQPRPGDWESVGQEVARDLRRLLEQRRRARVDAA